MAGAEDMTTPASKLTCDERCSNTFTTRGGYKKHMKNKHEHINAGSSKQTDTVLVQDDDEAIQEAIEDQELYDALNNIESDVKKMKV